MTDTVSGKSIVMWQDDGNGADAIVFQSSEAFIHIQQGRNAVDVSRASVNEFIRALRRAVEIKE